MDGVSRSRRFYPILKVQDSRQILLTGNIQPGLDTKLQIFNDMKDVCRTFHRTAQLKSVGASDRTLGYATTTCYDNVRCFHPPPPPPGISCAGKHLNHFICEPPLSGSQAVFFLNNAPSSALLGGWVPTGGRRISRGGWRVLPKAQRTAE